MGLSWLPSWLCFSLIREIWAQHTVHAGPDWVVITVWTGTLCQDLHLAGPPHPCISALCSPEHRLRSWPKGYPLQSWHAYLKHISSSPFKKDTVIDNFSKANASWQNNILYFCSRAVRLQCSSLQFSGFSTNVTATTQCNQYTSE